MTKAFYIMISAAVFLWAAGGACMIAGALQHGGSLWADFVGFAGIGIAAIGFVAVSVFVLVRA